MSFSHDLIINIDNDLSQKIEERRKLCKELFLVFGPRVGGAASTIFSGIEAWNMERERRERKHGHIMGTFERLASHCFEWNTRN